MVQLVLSNSVEHEGDVVAFARDAFAQAFVRQSSHGSEQLGMGPL